jgi:short-subunit dehydrogenase
VRGRTILDATEHDVRFTFDVNTLSHYFLAREFLPSLVRANHGMVVTVASAAAYVTVPNMVDYAASKAAARAFHEGLAAELATRYDAPRVRTVLVTQGYTKTRLFEGYQNDSPFLMPALRPETVAEAVVRQVLRGESGHVVLPAMGNTLAVLGGMPAWYQYRLRAKNQSIMREFRGRKVVEDVERYYEERGKWEGKAGEAAAAAVEAGPGASTVLVDK